MAQTVPAQPFTTSSSRNKERSHQRVVMHVYLSRCVRFARVQPRPSVGHRNDVTGMEAGPCGAAESVPHCQQACPQGFQYSNHCLIVQAAVRTACEGLALFSCTGMCVQVTSASWREGKLRSAASPLLVFPEASNGIALTGHLKSFRLTCASPFSTVFSAEEQGSISECSFSLAWAFNTFAAN